MLNAFKGLFASKKFWTAVLGGALTAGMNAMGVGPELQHTVLLLVLGLLGAQAATDFGKEAKK